MGCHPDGMRSFVMYHEDLSAIRALEIDAVAAAAPGAAAAKGACGAA